MAGFICSLLGFILAILPEGTRSKVDSWKSGFYHIARGAGVPVLLAYLDYPSKTGGIGPLISLTGDPQTDLAKIAEFYSTKTGKHPERTGPVRLSLSDRHSRDRINNWISLKPISLILMFPQNLEAL